MISQCAFVVDLYSNFLFAQEEFEDTKGR